MTQHHTYRWEVVDEAPGADYKGWLCRKRYLDMFRWGVIVAVAKNFTDLQLYAAWGKTDYDPNATRQDGLAQYQKLLDTPALRTPLSLGGLLTFTRPSTLEKFQFVGPVPFESDFSRLPSLERIANQWEVQPDTFKPGDQVEFTRTDAPVLRAGMVGEVQRFDPERDASSGCTVSVWWPDLFMRLWSKPTSLRLKTGTTASMWEVQPDHPLVGQLCYVTNRHGDQEGAGVVLAVEKDDQDQDVCWACWTHPDAEGLEAEAQAIKSYELVKANPANAMPLFRGGLLAWYRATQLKPVRFIEIPPFPVKLYADFSPAERPPGWPGKTAAMRDVQPESFKVGDQVLIKSKSCGWTASVAAIQDMELVGKINEIFHPGTAVWGAVCSAWEQRQDCDVIIPNANETIYVVVGNCYLAQDLELQGHNGGPVSSLRWEVKPEQHEWIGWLCSQVETDNTMVYAVIVGFSDSETGDSYLWGYWSDPTEDAAQGKEQALARYMEVANNPDTRRDILRNGKLTWAGRHDSQKLEYIGEVDFEVNVPHYGSLQWEVIPDLQPGSRIRVKYNTVDVLDAGRHVRLYHMMGAQGIVSNFTGDEGFIYCHSVPEEAAGWAYGFKPDDIEVMGTVNSSQWDVQPESFKVGDQARVKSKSVGNTEEAIAGKCIGAIVKVIGVARPGTIAWKEIANAIKTPPGGIAPAPNDDIVEIKDQATGHEFFVLYRDLERMATTASMWEIASETLQPGDKVWVNKDKMLYGGELWFRFREAGFSDNSVPARALTELFQTMGYIEEVKIEDTGRWLYVWFGTAFHYGWGLDGGLPFQADELTLAARESSLRWEVVEPDYAFQLGDWVQFRNREGEGGRVYRIAEREAHPYTGKPIYWLNWPDGSHAWLNVKETDLVQSYGVEAGLRWEIPTFEKGMEVKVTGVSLFQGSDLSTGINPALVGRYGSIEEVLEPGSLGHGDVLKRTQDELGNDLQGFAQTTLYSVRLLTRRQTVTMDRLELPFTADDLEPVMAQTRSSLQWQVEDDLEDEEVLLSLSIFIDWVDDYFNKAEAEHGVPRPWYAAVLGEESIESYMDKTNPMVKQLIEAVDEFRSILQEKVDARGNTHDVQALLASQVLDQYYRIGIYKDAAKWEVEPEAGEAPAPEPNLLVNITTTIEWVAAGKPELTVGATLATADPNINFKVVQNNPTIFSCSANQYYYRHVWVEGEQAPAWHWNLDPDALGGGTVEGSLRWEVQDELLEGDQVKVLRYIDVFDGNSFEGIEHPPKYYVGREGIVLETSSDFALVGFYDPAGVLEAEWHYGYEDLKKTADRPT